MSEIIVSETQDNQIILADRPASENPALAYIASLPSQHTRRNCTRYLAQIANGVLYNQWQTPNRPDFDSSGAYQDALNHYLQGAALLDWSALRGSHTGAIRAKLMELYKPGTVNVMLSALRGVLKEAWRLGQMDADEYRRAIDIKNVKNQVLPAGRDLQQGEILSLVGACSNDDSAAGVRDAAIVGILYTCALRRAELVKLELNAYDPETGQIRVISGKGRKDRTVYVTNGAKTALDDWLKVRGDLPGALFAAVNKGGVINRDRDGQPKHMTAQAVYNMLVKRAKEAGVKDFSPHDFRRTFAGDMLDRGVDIVTVQKLMGHASVETTGRYDRRPEAVKQQAAQKLHFPYQSRRLD